MITFLPFIFSASSRTSSCSQKTLVKYRILCSTVLDDFGTVLTIPVLAKKKGGFFFSVNNTFLSTVEQLTLNNLLITYYSFSVRKWKMKIQNKSVPGGILPISLPWLIVRLMVFVHTVILCRGSSAIIFLLSVPPSSFLLYFLLCLLATQRRSFIKARMNSKTVMRGPILKLWNQGEFIQNGEGN